MAAFNDNDRGPQPDRIELLQEIDRLRVELATSRRRFAEVHRLAHRDPLLDLPNRRSFMSAVEQVLARVHNSDHQAAVLFADMDGLKLINDRFGHRAGDRALRRITQVLVNSVRKDDLVGRLGGDEFGILLSEADELNAWRMALRIAEAVGQNPLQTGSSLVPLSVAVGVSMMAKGDSAEGVLARADQVMYRFKSMGGSPLAGLITLA